MSRLDQVYKYLDSLSKFLQPALPFINSHMVDYATKSHWDNILPERLRQDLEGKSVQNLKDHVNNLANGSWTTYEGASECNTHNFKNVESLSELIVLVGQHLVSNNGICLKPNQVLIQGVPLNSKNFNENFHNLELKFDPIMSAKKMHEVELMSEFIVKVANSIHSDNSSSQSVEYLVDIGSGKGYLSSYLALLYQFRVLAIDSSSVNTQGCEKRSANLQRLWSQLLRRAIEKQTLGEPMKRGKRWRAKAAKEAKQLNSNSITEETTASSNNTDWNIYLKNETMFVTENTDLAEVLKSRFLKISDSTISNPNDCEDTDFGLIGLHTCGNLGVDSMKLFLANPNARFMVNVPCCYHLLDEIPSARSGSSVFWNSELGALTCGVLTFPLSQFFQTEESFSLGRNARMVSSYSIHRLSMDEKEMEFPHSMLYRVLLQILINQKLGHTLLEYQVGKLGEKCSSFNEYVHKAIIKLRLEDKIKVTDAEIEELYESFDKRKRDQLHIYFLLRSIFAPLVEKCILLDRLAFLLEQDSVKEATIVELFDPIRSPRCHAILAIK